MTVEKKKIQTVCVYCGSADDVLPVYYEGAFKMGQELARRGLRVVYGAGKTGLMGTLADGALQAGGDVTGVVPVYLNTPQLIHNDLTHLEIVENIHLRKARMSQLADAFIAMPGGYGTFEELFETLTWAQIGLHQKPVGLYNIAHYFDPLITLVQHALKEGFIYAEHNAILLIDENPDQLITALEQYIPPAGMERWLNRGDMGEQ